MRLGFTLIELLVAIAIVAATLFPVLAQTFTTITTGPVVTDGTDGQGCAWVDFDNDGDLDLDVSCNRTGTNLLYRNDGQGEFAKITVGPLVNAGVGSVSASWADLNNDGLIDLFVTRQNGGPGLLFHQQLEGTFTQTTYWPIAGANLEPHRRSVGRLRQRRISGRLRLPTG